MYAVPPCSITLVISEKRQKMYALHYISPFNYSSPPVARKHLCIVLMQFSLGLNENISGEKSYVCSSPYRITFIHFWKTTKMYALQTHSWAWIELFKQSFIIQWQCSSRLKAPTSLYYTLAMQFPYISKKIEKKEEIENTVINKGERRTRSPDR